MDTVLKAAVLYVFLLLVFRLFGKRTLAQATPFDLVLVLIISSAVQNALTNEDHSLTGAFLSILSLVALDIVLSVLKLRSKRLERLLDDVPVVLVSNGQPLRERMRQAQVDEDDILEAARALQGLERLEQVRYAVLERNGSISIIPMQGS